MLHRPAGVELTRSGDVPAVSPRPRPGHCPPGDAMLKWALIFLVISIVAGALGFSGVSAVTSRIAKVLFFIFLAIFLVFLVLALMAGQAIF